jgi:hypothetical protein
MGTNGITLIPNFVKIGHMTQMFKLKAKYLYREYGGLITEQIFLRNESRLKKEYSYFSI